MIGGRPSCLLQSAGGEANRILLASALSSMRIICPNRVGKHLLSWGQQSVIGTKNKMLKAWRGVSPVFTCYGNLVYFVAG